MTAEIDDVLGLTGAFPRPGWVVLDAIRERLFTGEVVFTTSPEARVYSDRGRIYLAERADDPSLGARLVDAGALNAAQLEHGSLRVGDGEHLGRLFERVPSVDRHQVIVTTELMTEKCVSWLAGQRVRSIDVTPYRHHPSGVHRWERAAEAVLAPGDPLPAPAPDAAPVLTTPPEPSSEIADIDVSEIDADDMIRWNEPSWLDDQITPIDIAGRLAALRAVDEPEPEPVRIDLPSDLTGEVPAAIGADVPTDAADDEPSSDDTPFDPLAHDWIDRLDGGGLPDAGSDPLAKPVRLAPLPTEPIDRFELIWPSGDVDEQFGSQVTEPFPNPDIDRAGPTARLVPQGRTRRRPEPVIAAEPAPVVAELIESTETVADEELERWLADAPADDGDGEEITDEVVLAVRRAVASIETGSLAARRRLAHASNGELPVPGRLAARSEAPPSLAIGRSRAVNGTSVFDNLPVVEPPSGNGTPNDAPPSGANSSDAEPQRVSALRRLINSIRRR